MGNLMICNRQVSRVLVLAVQFLLGWTTIYSATSCVAEDRDILSDATATSVQHWFVTHAAELEDNYRWLHSHPELSFEEKETSAYVANAWEKAGFAITRNVGGYGIVGLLKNGDGPTLMLRTDLDALPISEKTGLAFASTLQAATPEGTISGVMHACGHDIHMTVVTGAARYLAEHPGGWRGTLMLVGQPAEERGSGAKAMLDDGLFTRFPRPDAAVALHVESSTPTGVVALRPGYTLANVDSVDIEVRGRGGHGASPEATVDPIVQAAELVLGLQSIVSREIKPTEPAVVTVGSIHGGTKHNIIGDHCHLQLTVRSYSSEVREQILKSIERRAKGVASACGAPEPIIKVSEGTPALNNDAQLTARLTGLFKQTLGEARVQEAEQVMGGEDFSQFGLAGVPIVMYRLGVISPARIERFRQLGQMLPSLHSAEFYPDLRESLETGIVSMAVAVMGLSR
jgi:amidohydrolase